MHPRHAGTPQTKPVTPAVLAVLAALASAPAPGAEAPAVTPPRLVPLWIASGLPVPESVLWDPGRQVFYVSCIGGQPTGKDGDGTIARLSAQGEVLARGWARGMDAPKGMGLVGGTLWVTDIDRLHAIDTASGRIVKTVPAPGAEFLNDIAVGPGGEVYVSDMTTGRIHVLRGDALPVLADLSGLKGSNGMLMQAGALLVGTATGIARVDVGSGRAEIAVPVEGFGMIDGLRAYGQGAYLVSNWAGRTQLVRPGGPATPLLDTTAQKIRAADLEYVEATRTLLIPTFTDNRVVAYRLEP
ncbi:MAG TPA: ATP/GTP-binding protein [Myxococcota bacterium]|nr:ATP/GTP-binding protein [Myxococcota bacterium]HRY96153.1 ATP/GTP-binding protein [Myxococcota bacterium]